MSVIMPLCWYPWLRARLKDDRYILTAMAVFVLFPSFIGIYSFFQPETLVLPLMGLALWSTEACNKSLSYWQACLSGFLWGLAVTTKITLVVFAVTALGWFIYQVRANVSKTKLILLAVLSIVTAMSVYSTVPVKIYRGLHIIEFAPGMYHFNKMLYESGDVAMIITGKPACAAV